MEEEIFKNVMLCTLVGLVGIIETGILVGTRLVKYDHSLQIDRIPRKNEVPHARVLDKKGIRKEASTIINEFISTMKSNNFDLSWLYENFTPHSIEETKSRQIGSYDRDRNVLIVDPDNLRPTLLRALLDESTTIEYRNFDVTGFERTTYTSTGKTIDTFGRGLNEGYKDIILKRYFGVDYLYPELAELTLLLEWFIGRETMEPAFFKGDLNALTNSFAVNNNSTTIAENWILRLDSLYESFYNGGIVQRGLAERRYRYFLIMMSKLLMKKAELEFRPSNCYPYNLTQKSHVVARQMLDDLNEILLAHKKEVILEPGLRPKDFEELKSFSEKTLDFCPIKMNI